MKGGLWALGGKIALLLISLTFQGILARSLSPTEFGSYGIVFSIVSLFAILAQFGINNTYIRIVSGKTLSTSDKSKWMSSAIILVTIFSILSVFLLFLADSYFYLYIKLGVVGNTKSFLILSLSWVFLLSFQTFLADIFRADNNIKRATLVNGLITNLLSLISIATIIHIFEIKINLFLLISVISVCLFVNIIGNLWSIRSSLCYNQLSFTKKSKQILTIACPILMTTLLTFSMNNVDIWVAGKFLGAENTAIYLCAKKLILLLSFPLTVINAVLPPLIVDYFCNHKRKQMEELIRTWTTLAFIPSFLATVALIFAGETIISFVFGGYYESAYGIMLIIASGQLINVFFGSSGLILTLTSYQNKAMVITICSGIFYVIASCFLVYFYALTGLAIANALTFITTKIVMYYFVHKDIGIASIPFFSFKSFSSSLNNYIKEKNTNA